MSGNASYAATRSEEQPLDPAVVRMTEKASWDRALNGGQILNKRYLRGTKVGTGQHGSVYLAYDLDSNDRQVVSGGSKLLWLTLTRLISFPGYQNRET